MGLEKIGGFDHSADSVFRASGYSDRTVTDELEPRAALLANQIVDLAGPCPTMAIEVLMDTPVLRDSALDNRDRAFIIVMTAPIIAATFVQQPADQGGVRNVCRSNHGFTHNADLAQHEVLGMNQVEWDMLTYYAKQKVYEKGGQWKASELVECMQKVLDDPDLNSLQKAVVEALVVRESATDTTKRITASSGAIGPLAAIGRPDGGHEPTS